MRPHPFILTACTFAVALGANRAALAETPDGVPTIRFTAEPAPCPNSTPHGG